MSKGSSAESKYDEGSIYAEGWRDFDVIDRWNRTHPLLIRRDETAGVTHVLSRTPRLVRSVEGRPEFSLYLILVRQPDPQQENVRDFIQRSTLRLDLQIDAPQAALDALRLMPEIIEPRRLFVSTGVYTLKSMADTASESPNTPPVETLGVETTGVETTAPGTPNLAQAQATGTEARAALSAGLTRAQTLDVLSALDEVPGNLCLFTELTYRVPTPQVEIRLAGEWAAIYDYIQSRTLQMSANGQSRISAGQLRQLVGSMVVDNVLSLTRTIDGASYALEPDELYRRFMLQSLVILSPSAGAGMSAAGEDERWYTLRGRPVPGFYLDYTEQFRGQGLRTIRLKTPLHCLVGGALVNQAWNEHIHLIVDDTGGRAPPAQALRRVQARRKARGDVLGTGATVQLAAIHNTVHPVVLAQRPSVADTITARPLMTAVRPVSNTPIVATLAMDDWVLELPNKDRPRSLPIVDSPRAPFWRDRLDASLAWYAPALEVVQPAPNMTPAASPFLFTFERIGTTATGEPALNGTVRFTLRLVESLDTAQAIAMAGLKKSAAVSMNNLAVALLVPFIDNKDGTIKQQTLTGTIEQQSGTIVATVHLLNDWVRLCYGALAVEGFQQVSAQFQVTYTFAGYAVVKNTDLQLVYGGKAVYTPVIYSAADAMHLGGRSYFDATRLSFVHPAAEVRYRREADAPADRAYRGATNGPVNGPVNGSSTISAPLSGAASPPAAVDRNALVGARPVNNSILASIKPNLAIKPELGLSWQGTGWVDQVRPINYAMRTQARQETGSLLYPCNTLGAFYREKGAGEQNGDLQIGCRDALQLGQLTYRLYEEVNELRDPAYRVYRMLAQPGQFVVAPTQFCISRRAAGEADAYRPLIFLHATLDPTTPQNNRVNLRVTLQPDIAPAQERALLERLGELAPAPVVNYVTDIPVVSIEPVWMLDSAIASQAEVNVLDTTGPFINAFFATELVGWQLMLSVLKTSGVQGSIRFNLPDGSSMASNLVLKLDYIIGPWTTGPIELALTGARVRLTNRIEQRIDVHALRVEEVAGGARTVAVESTLAPNEGQNVELGGAPGDVYAVYTQPPGGAATIDETRAFVENIFTNIIFINLLNFANHGLSRLDIEARVKNVDGIYRAQLTQAVPVADIPIILSLTIYLQQPIFEFRIAKRFAAGTVESTDWMEWNRDDGPVSITRDLLGL